MVSHLSCLLFAVSLLLLTADGRKYVEGTDLTTSSTSSVNSTDYSITTHPDDVMGLMKLINEFPHLSGMQFPSLTKDPCSPHKLTWISCRNDPNSRRVTALYLGKKNLHGPIPDFSSMDALETIDLHENFLSGPIPGFFTSFPKLKYLNLANNSITLPLSDSVSNSKKMKLRSLAVAAPSYCTNYPYLCTCIYPYTCAPPTPVYRYYIPPPSSGGTQFPMPDPTGFNYGGGSGYGKPNKPSKLPKILGISIPSGLVAAIGGGCCFARRRNRQAAAAAAAQPPPLLHSPVSYPPHNYNFNHRS